MTIKLCLFRRIDENKERNTPLNPLLIEGKILDNTGLTRRKGTRLGMVEKTGRV